MQTKEKKKKKSFDFLIKKNILSFVIKAPQKEKKNILTLIARYKIQDTRYKIRKKEKAKKICISKKSRYNGYTLRKERKKNKKTFDFLYNPATISRDK